MGEKSLEIICKELKYRILMFKEDCLVNRPMSLRVIAQGL